VYGRLFLHTGSTALPIFIPMTMAFLYLLVLERPTEDETRKVLRAIAVIGLVYVALNALANSGLAPTLQASRSYRNADVMYIALGFAAVVLARWRVALVVFGLLAAFVFVTYPSATSAMVALVTCVTLFITRSRGSMIGFYRTGLAALLVLVVALFAFPKTVRLAGEYFSAVGKRNNTNARLALWEAGIEKFTRSPLFGDAFSGETTVLVYRQAGRRAPFHNPYNNDYVLFLASGGAFGFVLLVGWIGWVETTVYRRYRGFAAAGRRHRAALLRALLVGFNAWLTAAAFNPLFSGTGRSMSLFAMYGLMMVTGRPPPPERLPLSEGALARAQG
jgi:O-antigen ligase